jgi:CheY-like chemotaxis protein
VLVVDDERRFRIYLERILADAGHAVRTAADDAEALRVAAEFAPDVLIADWMLRSSVDGLALAAALRERHPDLLVIVITGHPPEDLEARLAAGEIAALLEKPFLPDALRDAVARVLAAGA